MPETDLKSEVEFSKLDEERQIAFGWAYQAIDKNGEPVVDHSGDILDPKTLEDPVYDYVLHSREGDVMHGEPVKAHLVESMVITPEKLKKMGVDAESSPTGWWVGFKVEDEEVWSDVKDGNLGMFSIAGRGTREPLE